jgi:hypothetical protein
LQTRAMSVPLIPLRLDASHPAFVPSFEIGSQFSAAHSGKNLLIF